MKFLAETNQENREQQNRGAKPKNAEKTTQKHAPDLANLLYKNIRSAQTVKKRGIKNNRPSLDNQPSALRIYYWTLQLDFFALRLRRIKWKVTKSLDSAGGDLVVEYSLQVCKLFWSRSDIMHVSIVWFFFWLPAARVRVPGGSPKRTIPVREKQQKHSRSLAKTMKRINQTNSKTN